MIKIYNDGISMTKNYKSHFLFN